MPATGTRGFRPIFLAPLFLPPSAFSPGVIFTSEWGPADDHILGGGADQTVLVSPPFSFPTGCLLCIGSLGPPRLFFRFMRLLEGDEIGDIRSPGLPPFQPRLFPPSDPHFRFFFFACAEIVEISDFASRRLYSGIPRPRSRSFFPLESDRWVGRRQSPVVYG